jgi:hypothetical protein|tara:strand:+ start:2087 stop:2686 length:600 start_codon:yes stop_codon:yes gene_type:complete
MALQINSSDIIENYFVDLEVGDYGYNNEDFYKGSAQRMRYLLATMDLGANGDYADKKPLEPGQEDNRFCDCIEFHDTGYAIKNDKLYKELLAMSEGELEEYIEFNEFDWIGDDYDHITEYLFFISRWNEDYDFDGDAYTNDEAMEIVKTLRTWVQDPVNPHNKSENKYEVAYNILNEYWDCLPEDERTEISERLQEIDV